MARHLLAACAVLVLPAMAPAATLSWVSDTDHEEGVVAGPVDGVTILTPDGLSAWDDSLFTSRGLVHPDPGLGVCAAPCHDGGDSIDEGEWIGFDFGRAVAITSLFVNWTPPAFADAGGNQAVMDHVPWTGLLETSAGVLDVVGGLWTGLLTADLLRIEGWNAPGNSEAALYVGGLTYEEPEPPAPVPVPASLGFALAGLVGLGALRAVKRAA